MIKLQS